LAVGTACPTQMAVEVAVGKERRECRLNMRRRCMVGQLAASCDRLGERLRDDEPSESDARGEALGKRSAVDHTLWCEALQRPYGMAVVTVLRVVVVFDDVAVDRL